jgi:hypothetical protein
VNRAQLNKVGLWLLFAAAVIVVASSRYYGNDYHISLTAGCEPVDSEAQLRVFLNGRNYWANQRKLVEDELIFLSPASTAEMEALSDSVLAPYPALQQSVVAGEGARRAGRTARLRELAALYKTCKANRPEWTSK